MITLKIGAVSYLNTKPFLYGLYKNKAVLQIEIVEDYPSKIAEALVNNEIDIALVPVAILPTLKEYYFISNYCIGATQNVASVSLFSQKNIDEIDTIILDYQSKTSVALTKILCKYFWKKDVEFIDATENYIEKIKENVAAVVIGDRALQIRNNYKYNYDLAQQWQAFTGLPFVFATWVSNKKFDENFIKNFNKSLQIGFENLDEVIKKNKIDYYDLKEYYSKNISYNFNEEMKKGLFLFLDYLQKYR